MNTPDINNPAVNQERLITMLGVNLEQIFSTDLTFVHDVQDALNEDPVPTAAELANGQNVPTEAFIQRFLVGLLVEAAQKLFVNANDVSIQIELTRGETGASELRKIVFDRLCNEFSKFTFDNKSQRLGRAYSEFLRRPKDIERRTQQRSTKIVSNGVKAAVSQNMEA